MSCIIRKPAFCKCEIKGADQVLGNPTADQRLCFRYIHVDNTIHLKSQAPTGLSSSVFVTAWFVSDLVGNPKDRFCTHIRLIYIYQLLT